MASYPGADPTFPTRANGGVIDASHVNVLGDEIVAIGSALRGTLQHDVTLAAGRSLSVGGNSTLTGSVVCSSLIMAPAQPRCMVYSTAAQAFAAGVFTAITFESEEFDVGGLHSTASNPSRLTIQAGSSGLYLFGGLVRLSTGGAGDQATMRLIKNSTTEIAGAVAAARASSASITLQAQFPAVVDGGDFFELELFPTTSTGSMAAATVRRSATDFWCVKLW